MTASPQTIEKVFYVLSKHVEPKTLLKIVAELKRVPGNKSFRETIERLAVFVGEK